MKHKNKQVLMYMKGISWVALIIVFFVLSLSAVKNRQNETTTNTLVFFKNEKNLGFVNSSDILNEMKKGFGDIDRKKIKDLNLYRLEQNLSMNNYVKNANVYIDQNKALCIQIEPKNPILRVNTPYQSYYISENWDAMPISKHFTKRTIQVGGNTKNLLEPLNKVDSFKLYQIKMVYNFLNNHSIWTHIIDQIYITPNGKIKLITVLCDAHVNIGYVKNEKQLEKRMNKLKNFIKIVPKYNDLNKYKEINIQYSKQVIAIKK